MMKRINIKEQLIYTIEEEPIVLSKALLDQFLSKENPDDLISLYCFYYYTAKWQKTNQPKATDSFCMSGLHWGYEKFKKAKSKLIEMGLIEKIQSREKGMITAWYVKVNFIWTASKINQSNQNYENPELVKPRTRFSKINALSTNKENALSTNNSSQLHQKITLSMFDSFWKIYPKKKEKGKALTAWTKLCDKKTRPTWVELKRAILEQKKTERWDDPKYIPYPSTWLNQNRWVDDPKEMTVNKDFTSYSNTKGSRMFGKKIQYRKPDQVI